MKTLDFCKSSIFFIHAISFCLAIMIPIASTMFTMSSPSYHGYSGAFTGIMLLTFPLAFVLYVFNLYYRTKDTEEDPEGNIEKRGIVFWIKRIFSGAFYTASLIIFIILMIASYGSMFEKFDQLITNDIFKYGLIIIFVFTLIWTSIDSEKIAKGALAFSILLIIFFIGLAKYDTKKYEEQFLDEGIECSELYWSIYLEKGESYYSLDGERTILNKDIFEKKSCVDENRKLYFIHKGKVLDPDERYGCGSMFHEKKHPKKEDKEP